MFLSLLLHALAVEMLYVVGLKKHVFLGVLMHALDTEQVGKRCGQQSFFLVCSCMPRLYI